MSIFMIAVAVFIAYLFGSVSSAIIVCKLMRLPDPRTEGSRNPGATNVLRIGGKKAAIITLLGDVLKGVIPVLLAVWLGFEPYALALIAFAAFLGHLYPIFFGFEGGKGVATAMGCLLALAWPAGLASLITWVVVAILFRYSSVASMTTALLAPVYLWFFTHELAYVYMMIGITLVLIFRHRSNIANLYAGTERKLGAAKK